MLTYEILKLWFNFIEWLPDELCWTVFGIVVLMYLIFKKDKNFGEFVGALATLTLGPLLLYAGCCLLVSLRGIPLIGVCCIIIQLAIDASIIAGIVVAVRSALK